MWAFVAGEADKADLACLSCSQRSLNRTIGAKDPIGIAIIVDFMELPNVNDIGLESAQTLF
jgi:hypothetical protein